MITSMDALQKWSFGILRVQANFRSSIFLMFFIVENVIFPSFGIRSTVLDFKLQTSPSFLMFQETNSWHDSSSLFLHSWQEFGLPFLLATLWYLPTFRQLRSSFPQWWLRCATWRNDHTAFGESERRGCKMAKGWMRLITPAAWWVAPFLVWDWKTMKWMIV